MSDVEYRAMILIPGLDIESEDAGRLLVSLERLHGDLGPVLDGNGDGLSVILATDQPDEVEAAGELYRATAESLLDCGLTSLYPTAVEIEPADDLVAA